MTCHLIGIISLSCSVSDCLSGGFILLFCIFHFPCFKERLEALDLKFNHLPYWPISNSSLFVSQIFLRIGLVPATVLGFRRQSLSLGAHILGGIDIRHLTLSYRIKIVIDALKDTPVVLRGYDRGTEQVWGSPAEFPRDDVWAAVLWKMSKS